MKESDLDRLDPIVEGAIQRALKIYSSAQSTGQMMDFMAEKMAFEEASTWYYEETKKVFEMEG